MMTAMDKDRLAAFVDGELSPEEAAAVVLHLADHPADQAWVDDVFAANEALQQAFSAPLHDAVPEAIRAAIMGPQPAPNVVDFRARSRGRAIAFGGLALAASVALAVGFLPSLMPDTPAAGFALGPLPPADPVAVVLDRRASGDALQLADGREAMVMATYAMPDGRFCREFEVIDRTAGRIDIGLGCRSGAGWTVEAVIAESVTVESDHGFIPAGGAETDALTQYLKRSGTPQILDPSAEAVVMGQGWSR